MHRFLGRANFIAHLGGSPALSGGDPVVDCGFKQSLGNRNPFGVGSSLIASHNGASEAFFGQGSDGEIPFNFQDLATMPDGPRQLDFWPRNDEAASNDFQLYWGGMLVLDALNSNESYCAEFTCTLAATSSSTELRFQGHYTYYLLDDLNVTPTSVPEPSSVALNLPGAATLGGWRWRRRRGQPHAKV